MASYSRIRRIDLNNKKVLKILSNINGERDRVLELCECQNEADIDALEWVAKGGTFSREDREHMGVDLPHIMLTQHNMCASIDRQPRIFPNYLFNNPNTLDYDVVRNHVSGDEYLKFRVIGGDWYYNNKDCSETEYLPNGSFNTFDRIGAYITNIYNNGYIEIIQDNDGNKFIGMTHHEVQLSFKSISGNIITNESGTIRTNNRWSIQTRGINKNGWENGEGYDINRNRIHNIGVDYGGDFACFNYEFDCKCNFYIFENPSDLEEYLLTGNSSKALNDTIYVPVEEDDTLDKLYYIHSQVWNRDNNPQEGTKNYIADRYTRIKVNNVVKRPFTLTLDNDTQVLHLNVNPLLSSDNIVFFRESDDNGETWHDVTLDTFHNNWWRYTEIKKINGKYEGADFRTNIPIFKNELETVGYFTGLLDESNSLNPIESIGDQINDAILDIGTGIKIQNELNIQNVETSMSEIIIADETFFNELAGVFNDDSLVNELKEGLKLHNNPYDIFIDYYALPFNAEEVLRTSLTHNTLDFGTYEHTFSNSFKYVYRPKECDMFTAKIPTLFNDWRDYECNIYLYLPYVNIIQLNTSEVINRTLKVTFIFDVISCTIKYFIKINNLTVQTAEGSVRYSLPLSASNIQQGFLNKIGGVSQLIQANQEHKQALGSLASGVGSLVEGDIGSGINSLMAVEGKQLSSYGHTITGIADILRPTPKTITGNYSNGTAFYDELSAYLIIEQQNLMYPNNIKELYNLPDNRVSTIGSCTGYAEFKDVELTTSATESEQAEILSYLASGVIV